MKRYLTSKVVREMQIKTTMRCHLTSVRMREKKRTSVGKDVEKFEPLCIVGGTVKWYNWYGSSIVVP